MLILMECVLGLVALDLFLAIDCLLQSSQLFLITHQQVSDRNIASKIFLSVLLSDGEHLSWLSRFSLFDMFGYMGCFFNDFGCSELMLRKVWRSVLFLNILICNVLFLIYISVSRNEMKFFLSIFHR